MKSPFKFLDPFTLDDRDEFFGRDNETQQLYREVLRTRLLLLYGLSGTGKTSLIQCGLAGEFDGPDWLPLWIRRQSNINLSLESSIRQVLTTAEGTLPEQIRQLYKHFLRPVYLIFDQFEELFILGDEKERETFAGTLQEIMEEDLPCTVIMVIREEYLGRLYPIEKVLPNLFDFRMRVEPMDTKNVGTVLKESFRRFNISVEGKDDNEKEKRYEEIISKVSRERSAIELTDLQIYLDQFYSEDYKRTHPNAPEESPRLPIIFTKKEIADFGSIDDVLSRFMDEQKGSIQASLKKENQATHEDTVKSVLNGFVSPEGTKRPIKYTTKGSLIQIANEQRGFFPTLLSDAILSLCLDELERVKILRAEGAYMELRHDNLAQKIYNERTVEQRKTDNIKIIIKAALDTPQVSREYLTSNQLAGFEDVAPLLDPIEKQFYEDSKKIRKAEAEAELKKEQDNNTKLTTALDHALKAKKNEEIARSGERVAREKVELALQDALTAKQAEEKAREIAEKALSDAKTAKRNEEAERKKAENAKNEAENQARQTKIWLVVAVIAFIGASILALYAFHQKQKAEFATKKASESDSLSRINLEKADKNLKQFQASEFNAYLLDAETFQKSGDTLQANIAIDSARNINERFFGKDLLYKANLDTLEKVRNKLKGK